jgi:hypothetical protein
MSLLKEKDAMKHRSSNLRTSQIPAIRVSHAAANKPTRNKPEPNSESNQPFLEDFNMEHCCSAVAVALIASSANVDSMDPRIPRNPHAHPFNAPSCVYLG